MKRGDSKFVLNCIFSVFSVAFSIYIAVKLADSLFFGQINQIAPFFGAAFGIVWLGGRRSLSAVFIAALLLR